MQRSTLAISTALVLILSQVSAAPPATTRAVLDRAATEKKSTFVFFFKEDNAATTAQRKVFDAALAKLADQALPAIVNIRDTAEKELVAKFQVAAAPMPLVLVVAPNGAITGSFTGQFDEAALLGGIASPGMQQVIKALQERKLVFVCVQNDTTKLNDAASKGVNDFTADARYAKLTEIIKVDPADAGEQKLLSQLQVDAKATEATTAFLAPPGTILAKFTGSTEKKTLEAALPKASAGCGPGASSGCCPVKK